MSIWMHTYLHWIQFRIFFSFSCKLSISTFQKYRMLEFTFCKLFIRQWKNFVREEMWVLKFIILCVTSYYQLEDLNLNLYYCESRNIPCGCTTGGDEFCLPGHLDIFEFCLNYQGNKNTNQYTQVDKSKFCSITGTD